MTTKLERLAWTACAVLALTISAPPAGAAQGHEVDAIYRLFLAPEIDLEAVDAAYAEDVIHVGRPGKPLIAGRESFIESNILPLASVVNTGRAQVSGKFLIVRRVVGPELINDIGYFHSELAMEGRTTVEQLQKFSWVFRKAEDGRWQVITDFDATPADLDLLPEIRAAIVIE